MIRYPITEDELYSRIDALNNTWRIRASYRTDEIRNGTPAEKKGIWSEIKQIFMELQANKCAFCEKKLEDQAIEHDVEHFRPKTEIQPWRVPPSLRNENIILSNSSSVKEPGYRLLTYHPLNYATACKSCNSTFKGKYFPIAGRRNSEATDPRSLSHERAYCIFPVGNHDTDPEDLIKFFALSPQPRRTGFDRKRALVTIELFKLDDVKKRLGLLHDRAESLETLYLALKCLENPTNTEDEKKSIAETIERLTNKDSAHTNCLRCFKNLWENNRSEAQEIVVRITKFLKTKSPKDYKIK